MPFTGSYRPEDVQFLLKPISVSMVSDLEDKERLIQSGLRHYSEMLTPEKLPSDDYRRLFITAHEQNRTRMARDCVILAREILASVPGAPTIVSLARAGTPVGAILAHILRRLGKPGTRHYSVSIIRDRGIDANALDAILGKGCSSESVVFVDGWTGKGVITRELERAVAEYNASRGTKLRPHLYVLADLAGTAHCAASDEDYLIPSSILNATISGLVSRSVLNDQVGPKDFHGCVYYSEFESQDLSVWFVDDLVEAAEGFLRTPLPRARGANGRARMHAQSARFMEAEMQRHGITDANLVKPGIGEATRVLLRRLPDRLILRDTSSDRVHHLLALAREKGVPVEIRRDLPYYAAAVIRSAHDA